jgi:Phage integrase, N-terminal SAM-like domain
MAESPFLESIRTFMIVRNYSKRTIESYLYWSKYFISFNRRQHPGKPEPLRHFQSKMSFLASCLVEQVFHLIC